MNPADSWVIGNIREIGLDGRPDWVHVVLELTDPIVGRIVRPMPARDPLTWIGFVCEAGVSVPELPTTATVAIFGISRSPNEPKRSPAAWIFPMPGDAVPLIVELWRRYVVLDGCPFYARVDWRPESGSSETASIHGGEHDGGRASDTAYRRARGAQQALLGLKEGLLPRDGGRPRVIRSVDELDAILIPIVRSLVTNKQDPTVQRVAELVNNHELVAPRRRHDTELTERQLRTWIRALTGLTWDQYLISRKIRP